MERVAENVDKNVNLLDAAVYMNNFLNEEVEGTIICISSNGLTVQLDNLLEGRVRCRNLKGLYIHNSESYSMISLNGYDNYCVGDRLKLRLISVDKYQKSVDFEVIEKININISNNNDFKIKSKINDEKFRETFNK